MAVRNTAGDVEIEIYPTVRSQRPAICKKPFIRGIFGLIDSLSIGYKCLMRSADLSGTVSYTHLDVYKRQGHTCAPIALRTGITTVSAQRPTPLRSWMAATVLAGLIIPSAPFPAGACCPTAIPSTKSRRCARGRRR